MQQVPTYITEDAKRPSVIEAELSIPWNSLPNYCFLGNAKGLDAEHACLVRVDSVMPQGKRLRHLVEVRGKRARGLVNILAIPGTRSAVHPVSRTLYLDVVETPLCPLYETLSSTNCFLVKETVEKDHLSWDVIAESENAANVLLRKISKRAFGAKLANLVKIKGGRMLSDRQEQVLRLAYDSGFFDSPHKTGVRQLARALDCSPSTLVRILRKAEKKALATKFGSFPGGLSDRKPNT